MMIRLIAWLWPSLVPAAPPGAALAQSNVVILSTTTSTQDSGLLDVLVPMFEKQTGLTREDDLGRHRAGAGAGRPRRGRRHAGPRAGRSRRSTSTRARCSNRRLVMYNDFVIIGPADDPAKIKGLPKAVDALKRIAESQARFVSRGDKSGTHVLEQALWKQAGVEPAGAVVHRVGAGHGRRRSASPTTAGPIR